jgi:hypothetical protein
LFVDRLARDLPFFFQDSGMRRWYFDVRRLAMTRTPFTNLTSCVCSGLALVLASGAVTVVLAQAPTAPGHHDAPGGPAQAQAGAMMPDRAAQMAAMASADRKLTELVARMNAAKGDEKVAAIAAVVTELAAQRAQMQQMMQMHGAMMEKMMAQMMAMHGAGGMMKKEEK